MIKIRLTTILVLLLPVLFSCKNDAGKSFPSVTANMETTPVASADDAADDPAIWINQADPAKSLLICSNKQSGIVVYDLTGNLIKDYPVGKINNVDVRQGIYLNDTTTIDVAAGSNRTDNTITVMGINPDGSLYDATAGKIQSEFEEVYGFCLYHDLKEKKLYAIVNDKLGMVEQWHLFANDSSKIEGKLVRKFRAGNSQLEGCVGDDELGFLYVGEEDFGIWKFAAHPDSVPKGTIVDDLSNKALKDDIEGMSIYYKNNGTGYLVVSSQGNHSFAVYRREGKNEYIASFSVADGEKIDGVSETDGIDVTSVALGPDYPSGIFVAQDGYNYDGSTLVNQNFKVVNWEKIADPLKLK
ncbi:MAG: phytase [Bacteroidales bacterium]|jgi:3-phytase|nr:phytase [Bacteroidales bacterium]